MPILIDHAGDEFAQPALASVPVHVQRLPDVHGLKVRQALVGVSNALDDREMSFVPDLFEWREVGMKAQATIKRQNLVLWYRQRGAHLVVERVGVRYNGIEAIVATGQLYHDQRVVACRLREVRALL